MPKRERSNFGGLWLLPMKSVPAAILEFLQDCPRGFLGDNEQMLSTFLDHNKDYVEFWRRTSVIKELECCGIPCEAAFRGQTPCAEEFWVVKIQSDSFRQIQVPVAVFRWEDWIAIRDAVLEQAPFKWTTKRQGLRSTDLYLFGSSLWSLKAMDLAYPQEQLPLVFRETFERERRKDARRIALFGANASKPVNRKRQRIPLVDRESVWQRDGGCCVRCGANDNLQIDHIIPISKGGGNGVDNLELLCDICNQAKGTELG